MRQYKIITRNHIMKTNQQQLFEAFTAKYKLSGHLLRTLLFVCCSTYTSFSWGADDPNRRLDLRRFQQLAQNIGLDRAFNEAPPAPQPNVPAQQPAPAVAPDRMPVPGAAEHNVQRAANAREAVAAHRPAPARQIPEPAQANPAPAAPPRAVGLFPVGPRGTGKSVLVNLAAMLSAYLNAEELEALDQWYDAQYPEHTDRQNPFTGGNEGDRPALPAALDRALTRFVSAESLQDALQRDHLMRWLRELPAEVRDLIDDFVGHDPDLRGEHVIPMPATSLARTRRTVLVPI